MQKYRFSRAIIFQYKDRIYDSVLLRENTGGRKLVFWHILCSVPKKKTLFALKQCSDRYRERHLEWGICYSVWCSKEHDIIRVKKKRNYLKVTEAIPDVREVKAALNWKFYITILFSVRKEEKEYKI